MRTTLDLDDELMAVARDLATANRQSLGSVISDLARRGLTRARVEADGDLPVIRVPAGTPAITPQMVRRAVEED
ncbi:MAG: antitoxin [Actinomycetota bacterium]|nr:antitoxin [Actinomycetota bacterium]